jgi:hypothetical protein
MFLVQDIRYTVTSIDYLTGLKEGLKMIGGDLPATPRHMSRLLRLLPSRSDRVHKVSLRGDRKVTIETA